MSPDRLKYVHGTVFQGACVLKALHGDPNKGFLETIRDLTASREAQAARDLLQVVVSQALVQPASSGSPGVRAGGGNTDSASFS